MESYNYTGVNATALLDDYWFLLTYTDQTLIRFQNNQRVEVIPTSFSTPVGAAIGANGRLIVITEAEEEVDDGSIFVSTDNGDNFTQVVFGTEAVPSIATVNDIVIAVEAGFTNRYYLSNNSGEGW